MGAWTLRNFISSVFSSSWLVCLSLIVSSAKLCSLSKHVCLPPCQNLVLYLHISFACPAGRVFSGASSCRGTCPSWPLLPHFDLPQPGPPSLTPKCIYQETVKKSLVYLWRYSWSQTSHRAKQGVASWVGRTLQIPPEGSFPGVTAATEAACTGWVLGLPFSSALCSVSQEYTRETKSLSWMQISVEVIIFYFHGGEKKKRNCRNSAASPQISN